jgi:hypothetical protein
LELFCRAGRHGEQLDVQITGPACTTGVRWAG